eukprot:1298427-Amphidinium_carterae.1
MQLLTTVLLTMTSLIGSHIHDGSSVLFQPPSPWTPEILSLVMSGPETISIPTSKEQSLTASTCAHRLHLYGGKRTKLKQQALHKPNS